MTQINRFSSRRQRLDYAFLKTRLTRAISYKRIAGYFRSSIFELVGEKIAGIPLVQIVCNSELDVAHIAISKHARETGLKERWNEALPEVKALLHREQYRQLYDLLSSGRVEIRVVPKDRVFIHGKAGVIEATDGSKSCFLGSINETKSAFSHNYEILWEDSELINKFADQSWVRPIHSEEFDALSYAFFRSAFEMMAAQPGITNQAWSQARREFTQRVGKRFFAGMAEHLQLALPLAVETNAQFAQLQAGIAKAGKFLKANSYLRDRFDFSFDVKVTHTGQKIHQSARHFLTRLDQEGVAYALYTMGYPVILPSAVYLYNLVGEAWNQFHITPPVPLRNCLPGPVVMPVKRRILTPAASHLTGWWSCGKSGGWPGKSFAPGFPCRNRYRNCCRMTNTIANVVTA